MARLARPPGPTVHAVGAVTLSVLLVASALVGLAAAEPHAPRGAPAVLPALSPASVTAPGAPFWQNTSATDRFAIGVTPSSTFGVFGLTLDFDAAVNVTGGAIDAGTTRSGVLSVGVGSQANLSLDVLGVNTSVAVPALVGSTVNIPVPGVYYTVPVLGVQLGVEVSMKGTLSMVETTVGPGAGGLGNLSWTASGSRSFSVTANASAAGETLRASAGHIAYLWSAGLVANGTIPLLGTVTYDLLPFVTLGSFAGSVPAVNGSYPVVAPPKISGISTSPAHPSTSDNFTARANETGGSGTLEVDYVQAPAGCLAQSGFALACPPLSAGNYSIGLTVTDEQGQQAQENVSVNVAAAAPPAGSGAGSGPVAGEVTLLLALFGVAALALGAFWTLRFRRRRSRPPPS